MCNVREMHALTAAQIRQLKTPKQFTDVFRAQVGAILDCDFTNARDLPVSGITPGHNIFASSLACEVPDDIYTDIRDDDGNLKFWVLRFGFTPRALNLYANNYERVHGEGTFPKAEFNQLLRRAKNRAYQHASRARRDIRNHLR